MPLPSQPLIYPAPDNDPPPPALLDAAPQPLLPTAVASVHATMTAYGEAESSAQLPEKYQENLDMIQYGLGAWAQKEKDKYIKSGLQYMEELVDSSVVNAGDPAAYMATADDMRTVADYTTKVADSPLAPYMNQVTSVTPAMPENMKSEAAYGALVDDLLYTKAAATFGEDGAGLEDLTLSMGGEVAELLVVPLQVTLSGMGIHDFPSFIDKFHQLPAEDRASALSEFSTTMDEAGVSGLRQMALLDNLVNAYSGAGWARLDQITDAALVFEYAGGLFKAAKAAVNGARRFGQFGDTKTGAVLAHKAATVDDVAAALNISTKAAFDSTLPWKNTDILSPGALPDDLKNNAAVVESLNASTKSAEEFRQTMLADLANTRVTSTALTSDADTRALEAAKTQVSAAIYDKYDKATAGDIVFDSVEFTDTGVAVTGSIKSVAGSAVTKTVEFGDTALGTYGSVGSKTAMGSKFLAQQGMSPRTLLEGAKGENHIVNDATQLFLNSSKVHTAMLTTFGKVWDPLRSGKTINNDSYSRVVAAILRSDADGGPAGTGRRFKDYELSNLEIEVDDSLVTVSDNLLGSRSATVHGTEIGVDGKSVKLVETADKKRSITIHLTPAEKAAYYRYFEFTDTAGLVHHLAARDAKMSQGYKSIKAMGNDVNGKPLSPEASATFIDKASDSAEALLPDGTVGKVKGYKLGDDEVVVNLESPIRVPGTKVDDVDGTVSRIPRVVSNVIVRKSDVKDLPMTPSNRRAAYTPVIRSNTNYIIREIQAGTVDGVFVGVDKTNPLQPGGAVERVKAIRSGKASAEEDLARLNAEADDNTFYVLSREADPYYTGRVSPESAAGVGKGARASTDITEGAGQNAPDRLPFHESLHKYIGIVSKDVATSRWRVEHINSMTAEVTKALGRPWRFGDELPIAPQFEELRAKVNYTKSVLNVRSPDESMWESWTIHFGEMLDGKGARGVGKSVMNLHHKDPVQALRSANYHLKLGMFNPAQLFIQSMNVANAVAMHPIQAAKVVPDYFAIRQAMLVRDPTARAAIMRKMSPEMQARFQRFDQLGIEYAASNNPDFAMASNNLPTSANDFAPLRGATRTASHVSSAFVREGETFSQIMGFLVADQLYVEGRLGKGLKGDAALRAIADRQRLLTLNIAKSNRALYEDGVLSLGTQFMGVVTKMLEQMAPTTLGGSKAITTAEKWRLFTVQTALFGVVGTTATDAALDAVGAMYEGMTGKPADQMPEKLRAGVGRGVFGAVIPEVALSDRIGLVQDFEKAVMSLWYMDADMFSAFLGASESTLKQSYRSLNSLRHLAVDLTGEASYDPVLLEQALVETARLASSFKGAEKAYIMANYNYAYNTSTGGVLFHNPSSMEIVAQAFGFQPTREVEHWNGVFEEKLQERVMQKQVKETVRILNDTARISDDGLMSDNLHLQLQAMAIAATGGDPHKQAMFKKAVWAKLGSKVGAVEDRAFKEGLDKNVLDMSNAYMHKRDEAFKDITGIEE